MTTQRSYKAVLLDFGGTLAAPATPWFEYTQVLADVGIKVTAKEVQRLSDTLQVWDIFLANPVSSQSREMADQLRLSVDLRLPEALGVDRNLHEISQRINQRRWDPTQWQLFSDSVPTLEALLGQGVPTAIVSNAPWELPELIEALEIDRFFQAIAVSARVGYSKPRPEIFHHVLQALGQSPRDVVHVGDGYDSDVLGARSAGIDPLLLARDGSPQDDAILITSLFEILDLLTP